MYMYMWYTCTCICTVYMYVYVCLGLNKSTLVYNTYTVYISTQPITKAV